MSVYELPSALTLLADAGAAAPDNSIKVAIIAAAGAVVAAVVTALTTALHRESAPVALPGVSTEPITLRALIQRAELAEARAQVAEAELERCQQMLVENRINPYTGEVMT